MMTFLYTVHVILALLLIILVLLQSGKGAEMGASLGTGGSQTLFGSSGGATFFTRFTTVVATLFMCTSIALTYLTAESSRNSVMEGVAGEAPTAPDTSAAKEPTMSKEGPEKTKEIKQAVENQTAPESK